MSTHQQHHRTQPQHKQHPHAHSHQHPQQHYSKQLLAFLGFILLIPPLYFQILWMGTSANSSTEGKNNQFLSHFPESLQNLKLITLFSLACCIICIVLVSRSFNQRAIYLRVLSIIAAIVACFIALINIFQLFST
jgi:cation transport ATPase